MNHLPIRVDDARLPVTYESAQTALAECVDIDECQEWANKAEALASYAKMAGDDHLRMMADRIQARAVKRCGELLKEFDGKGRRTDLPSGRKHTKLTQRQAAAKAGLSKGQEVTARRVANIPDEDFEAAVESENPPSVTKLAEQGTVKRGRLKGKLPDSFKKFAAYCKNNPPEAVEDIKAAREMVECIDNWLDGFAAGLGEKRRRGRGVEWTGADNVDLWRKRVEHYMSTGEIAERTGRTPQAVTNQLHRLGITLRVNECSICNQPFKLDAPNQSICPDCREPVQSADETKERKCLTCEELFWSTHIGERRCPLCKSSKEYKSGEGIAI